MHVRCLIYGHIMTYNKQTVSRQMFMSGQHLQKRATFFTSESSSALFPPNTGDQTVTKGGMIMMQFADIYLHCSAQEKLYN